ncbi:maleylpyruvate isomerase N-terminal domain-containing protein [Lentzea sp. NPDC005914]|uniref:maleylpyruvate isomerase N-terminal domain-containing protein n=1 Tax=Lentzea sp. NPDC005914 TaxID=3154572 RepID=UPI0033D9327D
MTAALDTRPRTSALDRDTAMELAGTEYERVVALFEGLSAQDWTKPTDCPGWDVRAMAAHMLGMAEMSASIRESLRQVKAAEKSGGVFIDALTALQVCERTDMGPAAIAARYAEVPLGP